MPKAPSRVGVEHRNRYRRLDFHDEEQRLFYNKAYAKNLVKLLKVD